jgi:SAM-dependent methyltransferase
MENPEPFIFTREIAESYDTFYTTEKGKKVDFLEKEIIGGLISGLSRGPLLEIGCGTGHWTEYFQALGFQVTATDTSEAMLSAARRRLPAEVRFIRAAAENLPFADESFPIIAAITVLEFIQGTETTVREIGRVLRPGGTFIGGFLNADSELGKHRDADPVIRHGRLFSQNGITELLAPIGEAAGLESCVHFSPSMEILDGTVDAPRYPPAFIVILVKKGV